MAPEGTGYLGLEPYDVYWSRVRDMYLPFENGMKSGTARVFDHQIPGKSWLDEGWFQTGRSSAVHKCLMSLITSTQVQAAEIKYGEVRTGSTSLLGVELTMFYVLWCVRSQ